jgi:hypothetical protein
MDDPHDRADELISSMNLSERVVWLQRQGVSDIEILDALLDPDDHELDEFARDQAHGIAASAVNGNVVDLPAWLT